MSKQPPDLIDWDDDDEDDFWLPADFLSDDTDEDDIETIHQIQDMIGLPISQIIDTFDRVATTGRAGDVRAVRFSSGGEALLWLFRRGIFLYSTLVKFPDGSWGVAIGDSPTPLISNEPSSDISF